MKRVLAILLLGVFALCGAGISAASAADRMACAPNTVSVLTEIENLATPASYREKQSTLPRIEIRGAQQLACNSRCANACRQRFGGCPTRQCRRQYYACVRSCGCG